MDKKQAQKQNAANAGFWYTIANFLFRATGIITAPIFTRLLTPADYGIVSNFTSWQNIIGVFTGLCASSTIGRARIDFEKKFGGYLASIQLLSATVSAVGLALAVAFRGPVSRLLELDQGLVVIMFGYLCFYPSLGYMQETYRFEYKYGKNILISVYNTFLVIILSLLLILFTELPGYKARIIGMVIPASILGAVFFVLILARGKKEISAKYWKYALTVGAPLIPHQLAMTVLGQIDRVMIMKQVGEAEAGIYSFGYSYAVVVSIVVNAVCQAWQPLLYEYLQDQDGLGIKHVNNLMNEVVLIFAVFFIALAPEAVMLLGAKPFWDAKWMVAPVAIGTFYQYIYSNFSMVELYTKKTVWIAVGSVMAAAVNYGLNAMLIPLAGYHIAAVTTLIGYLALMLFHWVFSIRAYGKFVYDAKGIVRSCVIITLAGFVLMAMYSLYLARYLVALAIIALLLYRNRSYMKVLVSRTLKKGRG